MYKSCVIRRRRLVLVSVVALIALAPAWAGATGPTMLLSDAKGDARALGSGYDVLKAQLSTTGTMTRLGSRTVYSPTRLVASVTMAGPVTTNNGASITLMADSDACGGSLFQWYYTPGNVFSPGQVYVVGCGEPGPLGPSVSAADRPTISGNTLTWKLQLKELRGDLKVGARFSKPRIYVDQNDPVLGFVGTGSTITYEGDRQNPASSVDTSIDNARGTGNYVLG